MQKLPKNRNPSSTHSPNVNFQYSVDFILTVTGYENFNQIFDRTVKSGRPVVPNQNTKTEEGQQALGSERGEKGWILNWPINVRQRAEP